MTTYAKIFRLQVESCPFDDLPAAPVPLLASSPSREAPQSLAEIEYTTLDRDETGQPWRHFVDLDHGEWKPWQGPWRSLVFTTEARRHGEESCLTSEMRIGTQTSINGSAPTASETEKTTQTTSTPLGDVGVVAAAAGSNFPSVPLCPAPTRGMSVDELRGWRQVRDADGKLCGRFGPDSFADVPRWREWMTQLAQFPETSHVQA